MLSEGSGVVAVDGDTGAPVAFLPLGDDIGRPPACWAGPGTCPSSAWSAQRTTSCRPASSTWDYRSGELYPLAVLPSSWVAWGVGL